LKQDLRDAVGIPFRELNPRSAAIAMRYETQTRGDNTVWNYFEEGSPKYDSAISWQSFDNLEKAIQMLRNPSLDNISNLLGSDHKIRSFYNNQESPFDSIFQDVTIDTHAVAATFLMPVGQKHPLVGRNFGGGGGSSLGMSGMYWIIADATRAAAKERGILPRAMQSITWEGIRNFYPKEFRSNSNREKVAKILSDIDSGGRDRAEGFSLINDMVNDFHNRRGTKTVVQLK